MQDYASPLDCSQNRSLAGRNCWAEIDLTALARNARLLSNLGPELMAVLKANAYGHGIDTVAAELAKRGVLRFGVATAEEGIEVRRIVGSKPQIFVMTASLPQDATMLVRYKLTPFVSSRELLSAMSVAAHSDQTEATVHLEIDTGIGRAGIEPIEFADVLHFALNLPGIDVTGVCTHFTWGENVEDALCQRQLFERVLRERVAEDLLKGLMIHAANSPAVLNVPGARYGMIRPGLLLYGIAPEGGEAAQVVTSDDETLTLEPVLSLRARVILVRDLPAGTPISYGRTHTLDRPARIATAGIGYGDGYSRHFSNCGWILLPDGSAAPVRGRVCMDQVCFELPPGSGLAAGDVVTIIGEAGGKQLRAAEIAGWIGATPHEMTTCLTDRVARITV